MNGECEMIIREERRGFMVEDIQLGDLIWKNFAGRATEFKPEGTRIFNLKVDPTGAEFFESAGIGGVKNLKFDPEYDEEVMSRVPVSVTFGEYPPEIFVIIGGRKKRLTEDTVGMLDRSRIVGGDMYLAPWEWKVAGKTGKKLFLKKAYFEIELDSMDDKYSEYEEC